MQRNCFTFLKLCNNKVFVPIFDAFPMSIFEKKPDSILRTGHFKSVKFDRAEKTHFPIATLAKGKEGFINGIA